MIHMGDEYGHTKGGNNNTYCLDNFVILNSGLNISLVSLCLDLYPSVLN